MALPRKSGYHSWDGDDDNWDDEDDIPCPDQDTWRRATNLKGKFIGIELELESETGDYNDIIRAMPPHFDRTDGEAPHLEEDGSLDDDAGIEIIFPPLSPATLRDPTSYFYRSIAALNAWGEVHIHRNCGMHMNVNCNGWTDMKKALFVATIHKMPRKLLEAIGGRDLNGYCAQDGSGRTLGYYEYHPSDDHSYACEHKSNGARLECRFPSATTDLAKIARLTFFLEYLEDWAGEVDAAHEERPTPRECFDSFITWLGAKKDDAAKELKAFFDAA